MLLTSVAFRVAAWPLARQQVLVQELPAIEGLARVDVVCLDKTGTLTEGDIVFDSWSRWARRHADGRRRARGASADDATAQRDVAAARRRHPPTGRAGSHGDGAVLVGPQVERGRLRRPRRLGARRARHGLLGRRDDPLRDAGRRPARPTGSACCCSRRSTAAGRRRAAGPRPLEPVALVRARRAGPRPTRADTLAYFAEQGVAVKVISGDNPATVGAVAPTRRRSTPATPVDRRAHLARRPRRPGRAVENHSVFGRVTPAAEARHGRRAAAARPRRGDDRRRRQRRARPQGRRHRRGDGHRRAAATGGGRSSCCSTTASRTCPRWWPRAAG